MKTSRHNTQNNDIETVHHALAIYRAQKEMLPRTLMDIELSEDFLNGVHNNVQDNFQDNPQFIAEVLWIILNKQLTPSATQENNKIFTLICLLIRHGQKNNVSSAIAMTNQLISELQKISHDRKKYIIYNLINAISNSQSASATQESNPWNTTIKNLSAALASIIKSPQQAHDIFIDVITRKTEEVNEATKQLSLDLVLGACEQLQQSSTSFLFYWGDQNILNDLADQLNDPHFTLKQKRQMIKIMLHGQADKNIEEILFNLHIAGETKDNSKYKFMFFQLFLLHKDCISDLLIFLQTLPSYAAICKALWDSANLLNTACSADNYEELVLCAIATYNACILDTKQSQALRQTTAGMNKDNAWSWVKTLFNPKKKISNGTLINFLAFLFSNQSLKQTTEALFFNTGRIRGTIFDALTALDDDGDVAGFFLNHIMNYQHEEGFIGLWEFYIQASMNTLHDSLHQETTEENITLKRLPYLLIKLGLTLKYHINPFTFTNRANAFIEGVDVILGNITAPTEPKTFFTSSFFDYFKHLPTKELSNIKQKKKAFSFLKAFCEVERNNPKNVERTDFKQKVLEPLMQRLSLLFNESSASLKVSECSLKFDDKAAPTYEHIYSTRGNRHTQYADKPTVTPPKTEVKDADPMFEL